MNFSTLGPIRWWALALLGGMWWNLNSGLWCLVEPRGFTGYLLAVRASLPYLIVPLALLTLLHRGRVMGVLAAWGASEWLALYGVIAAVATINSYDMYNSHYWSLAFLGGLLVCWVYVMEAPRSEGGRQLMTVTWIVCLAGAVVLVSMAPEATLSGTGGGWTTISADLKDTSRSSGVARWAAVPGLVCLSRTIHARRALEKATYLALCLVAFWVVYRMQSRGAVFGVLGALAMLMLCSGRARRGLGALLLFGALATTIYGNMGWFSDGFVNYLYRGQDAEEFRSMTGRTRAYENARLEFATAPVLGRGQWNDRLSPIVGEHVHNSFYQALLNAGILGFVPYVLSWLVGWKIWIGLWRRRWSLMAVDRGLVLECGLVMGFFTLRAIPETTTASFAVDSMVMGACYCYLETLWSATNSPASVARRPRLARPLLVGARD